MSLLAQLQKAKAAAEAANALLQSLQANPELKKFQEFEARLRALLGEFGMSLVDVNLILDPNYKQAKPKSNAPAGLLDGKDKGGKAGTKNVVYNYTNPHTSEVVQSSTILKARLQEWVGQYGKETVLSWRKPVA